MGPQVHESKSLTLHKALSLRVSTSLRVSLRLSLSTSLTTPTRLAPTTLVFPLASLQEARFPKARLLLGSPRGLLAPWLSTSLACSVALYEARSKVLHDARLLRGSLQGSCALQGSPRLLGSPRGSLSPWLSGRLVPRFSTTLTCSRALYESSLFQGSV